MWSWLGSGFVDVRVNAFLTSARRIRCAGFLLFYDDAILPFFFTIIFAAGHGAS